jgi:hypothetical protein
MIALLPSIQPWALYAVVAVFAIGTLVNLIAPGSLRQDYVRWGYPAGFNFVTAAFEAVTLALLLLPATRLAGLILAGVIMIAAVATLVRAREFAHTIPALIVLLVSALLL